MPVAQDDYHGSASLLGHNNQVDSGILLKFSIALFTPLRFPPPPPRPSFLEPHADPRATSSYPSTRRHVPHANPLRAARPPTVRGSLHYDAPCLEKGRARARASTLRGHKGAKGGERRRPCCWRAPARKLTRRDPS